MNKEELSTKIGLNIKSIRTQKNIRQDFIAKKLGKDQSHVSHIESGHTEPTIFDLYSIAKVLETPFQDFLPEEMSTRFNNTFNDNSSQNNYNKGCINIINLPLPKTNADVANYSKLFENIASLNK